MAKPAHIRNQQPIMTDTLFHQSTHYLDAAPRAVFDAVRVGARPADAQATDIDQIGALIHLRHIAGTPGQVGAQSLARFNYGALDLEMVETILVIDPAHRIVVEQLPDRFRLFDRTERSLPYGCEIPDDIQAAFDENYGDPATPTLITFQFSPKGDGTEILLTVEAENRPKRGWFGRRAWQKRVAAEARNIALRIWNQLQVQ